MDRGDDMTVAGELGKETLSFLGAKGTTLEGLEEDVDGEL